MMCQKKVLNHIGVATKDIERELKIFEKLGYKVASDVFVDQIQKIRGIFIEAENQPRLELLENLTEDGPLNSHLARGNKFYHFAYETSDIEKDLEILCKETKAMVIVPITVAVYFEKICFVMLPNMMIVELVQLRKE